MDGYPLVLLQWLKFRGTLRRMGRALRSPKGVILTVIGLAVFAPQVLALTLFRDPTRALRVEGTRTFGPWILLALTIATLLTSGGERAIHFTPAEVGFLFPGPFGRRRLLLYKIFGSLGLTLLSALFLMVALGSNASWFPAAYVGLALIFAYLNLLTMSIALIGAVAGEAARTWRRRLVLAVLLGLAALALATSLNELTAMSPLAALRRLNESPVAQALLTPFRWFIMAFAADRFWPDLALWGGLGLAVDAALLGTILALDASYLELAATNSERLYAKLERMRRGGAGGAIAPTIAGKGGRRRELPMPPWAGGAGPIAWRQATTAWRDWARSLVLLLILILIAGIGIFVARNTPDSSAVPWMFAGTITFTSLFLTVLTTFDFRSDIDRIEALKTLPIPSPRLVLGQLVTPLVLSSFVQAVALAVLGVGTGTTDPLFWSLLLFVPAFNLILFAVENLMFLWFPIRMAPATPGDVQALGRAMLVLLAKMVTLALTVGLAIGLGAAGYFLGGWGVAAGAAWVAMALIGIGLIPLVARAFDRFDVARDTPA